MKNHEKSLKIMNFLLVLPFLQSCKTTCSFNHLGNVVFTFPLLIPQKTMKKNFN